MLCSKCHDNFWLYAWIISFRQKQFSHYGLLLQIIDLLKVDLLLLIALFCGPPCNICINQFRERVKVLFFIKIFLGSRCEFFFSLLHIKSDQIELFKKKWLWRSDELTWLDFKSRNCRIFSCSSVRRFKHNVSLVFQTELVRETSKVGQVSCMFVLTTHWQVSFDHTCTMSCNFVKFSSSSSSSCSFQSLHLFFSLVFRDKTARMCAYFELWKIMRES